MLAPDPGRGKLRVALRIPQRILKERGGDLDVRGGERLLRRVAGEPGHEGGDVLSLAEGDLHDELAELLPRGPGRRPLGGRGSLLAGRGSSGFRSGRRGGSGRVLRIPWRRPGFL